MNAFASVENHQEIVVGNVVGSNIFNLFLILGITGLVAPLVVQSSTVWKEIPISLFAALLLLVLSNDFYFQENNIISRIDGLILMIMFGLFLFYIYKQMAKEVAVKSEIEKGASSNYKIWGFILIGLTGLILGGKLVVDNAIEVATNIGVSEKIIGLTIIAAGTSLPELMTSVVAAFKKNSDIAIGNIIGSNIFNIFLILSISAFVRPIKYSTVFNPDVYVLISGTAFLFIAMFIGSNKKLDRWQSGLLLATFISYTAYLISKEI